MSHNFFCEIDCVDTLCLYTVLNSSSCGGREKIICNNYNVTLEEMKMKNDIEKNNSVE